MHNLSTVNRVPPSASSSRRKTGKATKQHRSRSRSIDDRMKGGVGQIPTSKHKRRHHSTGGISNNYRSCLRVKSQYESLRRTGLCQITGRNAAGKAEFAFLEVREYPMILGDHPSCCEGPPVTLDWAHDPHTAFILDVDTFERLRGERRPMPQMILSRSVRERSLLKIGFSKKDMVSVVRQIRKDKHSRMVSSQQMGMDNVHESVEKLSAGLKNMFVFRKSQYDKSLEASCAAN